MITKKALRYASWPHSDCLLWASLVARGGPLDERGALAHLRETSIQHYKTSYSYWLGWLAREVPAALDEPPVIRATADRLNRWMDARADLAPMSRFTLLEGLLRILGAAAPDADWTAQKRLLAHMRRAAFDNFGERKVGRIIAADVLVDAGLGMIASAAGASTTLQACKCRRDGLLITFLALMPMRLRALCSLRVDENLLIANDRYTVHLPRALCKAGGPWEAPLPSILEAPVHDYLSTVRPWLMRRGGANHDVLWVGDHGQPSARGFLSNRIGRLTERALGVRIPPHFFRDCVTTTLARRAPDAARLIRPILGHSGFRTAEKHYNHAQAIEAGRDYAALIDALKEHTE